MEATCGFCGATDEFWVWYGDPTRQTIEVLIAEDGTVSYDYTGSTDSGDGGSDDEEFMCGACQALAPTIEQLVGAYWRVDPQIAGEWAISVLTVDELSPSTSDLLTLEGVKIATWIEIDEAAKIVAEIMARYGR